MRQYRYPGPQPFSEAYQNVFFGREKEIEELVRTIRREPWLVIYGKSGLGKSSLLNAGVAPQLVAKDNMTPVFIRFHAWTPEQKEGPLEIAWDTLISGISHRPAWLEQLCTGDKSLWRILKELQVTAPVKTKPIVLLIFDQFEELFTFPQAAVASFARSLSEVFYSDIPERYRMALEQENNTSRKLLQEEELQFLHEPLSIRVVTAIRTDRMALMHQLKPFLPGTLDHCYELQPLSITAAEEAVLNPAYDNDDFVTPKFDYSDEALDTLLGFLSEGRTQPIESFQLQILCEYLEKTVVARNGRLRISADDLADPEGILENYYLDKIGEIKNPEEQLAARKLIEEGLIFEEEERRLTLFEGQIHHVWGVSPTLLLQLENTHLLRREPSLRGGYTYELSHDTLVGPVLKAKTKRTMQEKALVAEQEKLRREAETQKQVEELAKTRRRLRNTIGLLGLTAVALVAAIGIGIYARQQGQLAETAKREAQQNLAKAYQSDITRYRGEIAIAERNRESFRQYAAYDVMLLETRKIDSLNSLILSLNSKIKILEQ